MERIYRLDHAVTATQKAILSAFGLTVADVKKAANRISERLKIVDEMMKKKAMQSEELMKLFTNSGRSYDEVVEFLKSGMTEEQLTKITQKKRGRTPKI